LFGPKGMPAPVIAKLNKALNEMLEEAPIRERLVKAGVEVKGSTPQAWRQFMIDEYKKWSAVREKAGLEQR
jgi:tripartite-type tricarboxylate transporter receptor subunit TctC